MRHSGADRQKGRGGRHRPAILAALWTLIAVTLLSALAPLGPPLSRTRGSAFNPATSEVVVKTRPTVRTDASPERLPDGRVAPFVAILAVLLSLFAGARVMLTSGGMRPAPVHIPVSLLRTGRSRAPPSAA
ncbi:hypothetical protein SAMIE_1017760 [Sphingobium amiense]|uniref:Uncharacterized protein n=1 Tax=Sphingobium amiense TaxID=135719 RepID=A0A494WCK4_9SPHN|nr:hypothetical protein [Sphingobium amiense]BBD98275.1 hypothetical protein SAMIE_1017760 [Sphingobium amiense]